MSKKFIILCCFVLLLSVGGCSKKTASDLTYEGIPWGSNATQCLDILGLTKDDAKIFRIEDTGGGEITFEDIKVFGVQTTEVQFLFYEEEQYLSNINIKYPDDADMNLVYKNMVKKYGKSFEEFTYARVSALSVRDPICHILNYKTSDNNKFWYSKETFNPKTPTSTGIRILEKKFPDLIDDDKWAEVANASPLVYIWWTIEGTKPDSINKEIKNQVGFDASNLIFEKIYPELPIKQE